MAMSKEPLKYSLASKKKPAPKLKNILAQPLPRYWPEISEDDCEQLRQELYQAFNEGGKLENVGINLGMSSCLRLLKRNEINCLLLSGEIKPKFITTQIIYSVINKSGTISVLIVPELKKLTGEVLKVASLALGLVKGKETTSLAHWIQQKAESFPIPDKLLEYYRKTESNKNGVKYETKVNHKIKTKTPPENIALEDLYLPRNPSGIRAFIPANASQLKSEQTDKKWSDYISFSGCDVEPMEVDMPEKKTENISLQDLLQKTMKLKKEKKLQKNVNSQKESKEMHTPEKIPLTTSAGEITLTKARTKKKKVKNLVEDKSPRVFNYVSLKINKIQGNPDKLKKKKKNKNKK